MGEEVEKWEEKADRREDARVGAGHAAGYREAEGANNSAVIDGDGVDTARRGAILRMPVGSILCIKPKTTEQPSVYTGRFK